MLKVSISTPSTGNIKSHIAPSYSRTGTTTAQRHKLSLSLFKDKMLLLSQNIYSAFL